MNSYSRIEKPFKKWRRKKRLSVFQFHPVNVDLPVFLVHLFPWINGKVNSQIEQIMFKVGELMNKICKDLLIKLLVKLN